MGLQKFKDILYEVKDQVIINELEEAKEEYDIRMHITAMHKVCKKQDEGLLHLFLLCENLRSIVNVLREGKEEKEKNGKTLCWD